jgi:excisionase family DNA binding protein
MNETTSTVSSRLLTVPEAATVLAVSPSFVYALIQRFELPAVKMGRAVRIRNKDLESYISLSSTEALQNKLDYNDV